MSSKIFVFTVLFGLISIVGYCTKYISVNGVEFVWWLPWSASDIYAYNNPVFHIYEFSISESEFIAWASKKNLKILKFSGEYKEANRYKYFFGDKEAMAQESEICMAYLNDNELGVDIEKCLRDARGMHGSNNGYFGEEREASYRGYTVLYDSTEQRVFYNWASH